MAFIFGFIDIIYGFLISLVFITNMFFAVFELCQVPPPHKIY